MLPAGLCRGRYEWGEQSAVLAKPTGPAGDLAPPTLPHKWGRVGRGRARHQERAFTHPILTKDARATKAETGIIPVDASMSSKLLPQPYLGRTPDQLAAKSDRSPDIG